MKTKTNKKEEVVARLVVRGLPTMTVKEINRLTDWLENLQMSLSQRSKDYSSIFTAKLFK